MKNIFLLFLLLAGISFPDFANAQGLLKKLKEKAAQKAESVIDKKTGTDNSGSENTTNNNNNGSNSNSGNSGKLSNKTGAGLTNTTPPDVLAQLTDAETAHAAKNYSDARFSLQQALQGIEIQLGREILKKLPATVSQLPADTTQDKVMSTQWGWNNMSIQRVYRQEDKQLTVTIGNNSMYSGVVNYYFANASMIEANADQQNVKQVRVKGNKALIQYDENKGYTLMVQLGQSSLIVWECINFANEQEVMAAANLFDIESIKQSLGEN
ncbi:MAG TPA: hypothetical protein VF145_00100 [Chitinophagaceae bacterium]